MSAETNVPCYEGGPTDCVRVLSESKFVNPKAASAALAKATMGLGRTIDFYSVRTVGHYVVRPENLQPYSMQVVKSLEQRGSDQNQSYATKQEAGWSSTFAWPE